MGFHATIFVYGQTGSGKTYTMEGYKYAPQGTSNSLVPQIDRRTATYTKTDPAVITTDQQKNEDAAMLNAPSNSDAAANTSAQAVEEEGVIPRAIRELFSQVEAKRAESVGKSKISVKIQYI